MVLQKCKSCGGTLEREGNYLVCDHCHSRWVIDVADDIHAVARANAWEAIRVSDFEKAVELFEEIILKDKTDHEAYWGLSLAKYSIVYVNDIREGRKVPTCNNITEDSFLNDKNVKTAISLAPSEIAEDYSRQAEYIDKVRVEWLKKASKEPPYDVFISFKDSDEKGNRTVDSMEMQDLYTALVDKGYKVFYSRVSLKDKVAEQYEPYIYNAIKTAKVMIVYGGKAEYFSSTWIKNEWSRFKKRMEKGEKHKNALVTVFKGVNPYDIPMALTGGKQAIDYGLHSNYEVLLNHVKLVIDESSRLGTLDTVKIEGGKIGKKSSEIKNETLETRDVGGKKREAIKVSDQQLLDLVDSFISNEDWDSAENYVNQLILSNPNLIEAKWDLLKVKYRAKNERVLADKMGGFVKADLTVLERVLNETDKAQATAILNAFYTGCERLPSNYTNKVIKILLPFKNERRGLWLNRMFALAVDGDDYSLFETLLGGLESTEIDAYIYHNVAFARTTASLEHKKACLEKVLSVEEGNVDALDMLWQISLEKNDFTQASEKFKELLQYSTDINGVVEKTLENFAQRVNTPKHVNFALEIVRYYQGDPQNLTRPLIKVARSAQVQNFFEQAKSVYEFVLSIDDKCAGAYWGICLIKAGARDKTELATSTKSIKNEPEYLQYLLLVNEEKRAECMRLVKQQEANIAENIRREEAKQREKEERQKRAEEQRKREEEKRRKEEAARRQEAAELAAEKLKKTLIVLAMIVGPFILGAIAAGILGGFQYIFIDFLIFLQGSAFVSLGFYALEYVIYQTYFSDDEDYCGERPFNGWSKFLFILSSVALALSGFIIAEAIAWVDEIEFLSAIAWLIVSIIVICKSEIKGTAQFVVVLLNAVIPVALGLVVSLIFDSGLIEIPDYLSEVVGYIALSLLPIGGGVWYIIYQTFFSDDYDLTIGHKFLYAFFGLLFGVAGMGLAALFGMGDSLFSSELPIILCVVYTIFVWYQLYVSDEKSIFLMILIFASILVPLVSVWVGGWMLVSCV